MKNLVLDDSLPGKGDSDDRRSPVDQPAVVNIGCIDQGKLIGGLGLVDRPVGGSWR